MARGWEGFRDRKTRRSADLGASATIASVGRPRRDECRNTAQSAKSSPAGQEHDGRLRRRLQPIPDIHQTDPARDSERAGIAGDI